MLRQVAEGVLVHQSELLQNNTVVVQGRAGVLLIDAGITGDEMACLANDLPSWASPLWQASRRILIGITCSGTPSSAKRPVTAQPAARLSCEICCRTRAGRPASPRGYRRKSPRRYRWTCSASSPVCPPKLRRFRGMALQSGSSSIQAHAPGHAALLIEERGVLVAGDMLSDVFIPMLDDFNSTNDPIEDYLAALRLLEGVADDVDVVVPGHGSVGGAGQVHARIDLDRAYVHALRDGHDPTTRGSAHRPSPAGNGSAIYTPGKPSASPKEANAAALPADDRGAPWPPQRQFDGRVELVDFAPVTRCYGGGHVRI